MSDARVFEVVGRLDPAMLDTLTADHTVVRTDDELLVISEVADE